MRDFTLNIYTDLLKSLLESGFAFYTYEEYCTLDKSDEKQIILRHDVDKLASFSLSTAQVEHNLGIKGTYYFRIVKQSNQPDIIKSIRDLGHEIGYHYEDLSLCRGDNQKAIKMFEENLDYFRSYYPVKTICMHGSPMSKFDNRSIWDHFDYKSFDIIGEPYFDLDFNDISYITDTGRRWDGEKVSVRDKVEQNHKLNLHSTAEFIKAAQNNQLPSKIMITTHPQRWTNKKYFWLKELIFQNTKNVIKALIIK